MEWMVSASSKRPGRLGHGFYSELNLNQYSVGSPCRTICTVCGSPPCPDLNLIHYISLKLVLSGSLLRGGSLFLQLIQQLEGLARGEFVGVQRGELLQ